MDDTDDDSNSNEETSTRALMPDIDHSVFLNPIVAATTDDVDVDIEDYSPSLYSELLIILMYNFALTLHLHALSLSLSLMLSSSSSKQIKGNNDNNSMNKKKLIKKLFIRSREIYELTFELQLENTVFVDPLFSLALIKKDVRSKENVSNMISKMMYLMNSQDKDPSSQFIKEQNGLLSNVMNIFIYEVAAAAAEKNT